MPIQNYPRFLTKASKSAQQLQTGLPIVGTDGISGDFNALKVNTDGSINVAGGGGGGGDATASNQVLQINQETLTNTKLDTLNANVSQYSEQLQQTTELYAVNANTLQTQYNTADIITNTAPSYLLGLPIADLLESNIGNSAGNLLQDLSTYLQIVTKNSKWHTWCTKSFNANSGLHIWDLTAFGDIFPSKIVFTENGIEITQILDKTSTNVLSKYFQSSSPTIIANAGQELLIEGKSGDDFLISITTSGNCHFTAYYLITPYINPA
jgi:hypothetical protein